MINRELYFRDPTTLELLNNGVSKVSEFGDDQRQLRTLRFELESFVCDGEYAKGLERILRAYLDGLGRSEQKAVWVSGFFGSGKSHLVKNAAICARTIRFQMALLHDSSFECRPKSVTCSRSFLPEANRLEDCERLPALSALAR